MLLITGAGRTRAHAGRDLGVRAWLLPTQIPQVHTAPGRTETLQGSEQHR